MTFRYISLTNINKTLSKTIYQAIYFINMSQAVKPGAQNTVFLLNRLNKLKITSSFYKLINKKSILLFNKQNLLYVFL